MKKFNTSVTDTARYLRKHQTKAEATLWALLRNRQLEGYRFLRQHPIICGHFAGKTLFFVCDFYCAATKLIIELDGNVHEKQVELDADREAILVSMGYRVVRFPNEAMQKPSEVLERILESLRI